MQTSPFIVSPRAAARTGMSLPTVNKSVAQLEPLGILEETTGRKRDRVFAYRAYLDILSEGAQAPSRGDTSAPG